MPGFAEHKSQNWGCITSLVIMTMIICIAPHIALSADYPTKAVTIIVPFPPGGGGDVQARLIAKGLAERLGKPVIVDNRPGAGGAIGTALAARAQPDGYTLLYGVLATMVIEPLLRSDLGYDPQRDFAPLTLITEAPFVLVVPPSSPAKSVSELLSYARTHPGLTYASPGPETAPNLLGESFRALAQSEIAHVPYKGEAPAIADMLGDQISLMFVSTFSGMPYIRSGKLRALAVTARRRLRGLPDVPTFAEAGFSGFDLQTWTGLLVPGKAPPAIVARLQAEISAVIQSPEFVRAAETLGGAPIPCTPQQFVERMRSDAASFGKLVKALNFKVEQ